jgi:[acyl-carrier-protein] S-malonyltransferase
LDEARVTAVCADATAEKGIAQVANDNCPGQVVISGDRQGMEVAMDALEKAGARKIVPLAVSIASHSPLMQPAVEALRAVIDATPVSTPNVPIIANTTGVPVIEAEEIRSELVAQLTGSVRWTSSIERALDDGVTDFAEIGPGSVLSGLVRRVNRKAGRHTVGDPETVRRFAEWLWQR